jgi:hypothetical protein
MVQFDFSPRLSSFPDRDSNSTGPLFGIFTAFALALPFDDTLVLFGGRRSALGFAVVLLVLAEPIPDFVLAGSIAFDGPERHDEVVEYPSVLFVFALRCVCAALDMSTIGCNNSFFCLAPGFLVAVPSLSGTPSFSCPLRGLLPSVWVFVRTLALDIGPCFFLGTRSAFLRASFGLRDGPTLDGLSGNVEGLVIGSLTSPCRDLVTIENGTLPDWLGSLAFV